MTDGAYAKRPFLARAQAAGAMVASRLRKDAALATVPTPPKRGQRRRGRPRKYGAARIDLAKRAGPARSWQSGELALYGRSLVKRPRLMPGRLNGGRRLVDDPSQCPKGQV
ncbi:MAG: transposase [Planctomycetia bacterium]|nr:transposase [Planctomycetia bacterium]